MAASGVAGAGAVASAATPVVAQEEETDGDPETNGAEGENGAGDDAGTNGDADEANGNGNGAGNGNGEEETGGPTQTVVLGDNYFEPDSLTIEPGTTVEWVWEGEAQHDVTPDEGAQPDGADWEGHPELAGQGNTYEHTFEVEGTYPYICTPHPEMTAEIIVDADADPAAAGGEVDVHDVGVPILKHYVGVATFLAIFVSLVFTFYMLKYGESAHSSSPGRK
ncbi:hypothetical protein GCM10025298_19070 [Natronobiforma cellulositropha]